jgi:hypothetical protein
MRSRALASLLTLVLAMGAAAEPRGAVTFLDQGWTDDERQKYYYLAQGSEIMPYAWFLALEQPWNEQPFRDSKLMESFGYLPNAKNQHNPDGVPVGFTKGKGTNGETWFGLSCAACHTGQINHKGKTVRVDGGTTLADVMKFQSALVDAVRSTLAQPPKFARFAKRVLGAKGDAKALRELRFAVQAQLDEMANWEGSSRPAHPSGHGTWDAINILMNTINAGSIGVPDNDRTPQVPVSYPSIWLTTATDWLLWNASIQNGAVRAVGEVIIVFGRAKVTPKEGGFDFESSADIAVLEQVYEAVGKLKPPKWPEPVLGAIDQEKAKKGAAIYEREGCAKCHANQPPYPMTPKNAAGNQYIVISKTPLTEVGTDPAYAQYFVTRTSVPGFLAPAFKGTAIADQPIVPAALLFLATLTNITVAEVDRIAKTPAEKEKLLQYRPLPELPKTKPELDAMVQSLLAYKAMPLPGIWSTAPYLHNGSVPTLYQLLLPPDQRDKTFNLGSREFDPKNVGYQTQATDGSYLFDTSRPGQSNRGHEYGTKLSDEERWALLEYLKTL